VHDSQADPTADESEANTAAGDGAGQFQHTVDASDGQPFGGVGALAIELWLL
jgi:hypothetical protein